MNNNLHLSIVLSIIILVSCMPQSLSTTGSSTEFVPTTNTIHYNTKKGVCYPDSDDCVWEDDREFWKDGNKVKEIFRWDEQNRLVVLKNGLEEKTYFINNKGNPGAPCPLSAKENIATTLEIHRMFNSLKDLCPTRKNSRTELIKLGQTTYEGFPAVEYYCKTGLPGNNTFVYSEELGIIFKYRVAGAPKPRSDQVLIRSKISIMPIPDSVFS